MRYYGKKLGYYTLMLTYGPIGLYLMAFKRSPINKFFLLLSFLMFFNPLMDYGIFLSFIWRGPSYFNQLMELNESVSFSKISTSLFLKHCATEEIEKALDPQKKKSYKDL